MNSLSSLTLNNIRLAVFAAITALAFSPHALARDVGADAAKPAAPATPPQTGGYPAVPLLSTSKTIVGETIRYPRTAKRT